MTNFVRTGFAIGSSETNNASASEGVHSINARSSIHTSVHSTFIYVYNERVDIMGETRPFRDIFSRTRCTIAEKQSQSGGDMNKH